MDAIIVTSVNIIYLADENYRRQFDGQQMKNGIEVRPL